MKKNAIVIIILVLVCTLTGCSVNEVINSASSKETAGEYHLFLTNSDQEYLTFLENFDKNKYEILDISRGYITWHITYKDVD